MNRVQQEHHNGCGPACLAMILGKSYGEVAGDFAWNWTESGCTWDTLRVYLSAHGYAIQDAIRRDGHDWPPPPFAPLHIANVQPGHWIVIDADGRVFDPCSPDRRLEECIVTELYGIWRVGH